MMISLIIAFIFVIRISLLGCWLSTILHFEVDDGAAIHRPINISAFFH